MNASPRLAGAGRAIRALREAAGLSLRDLAARLHWDKSRLSKYENDQLALSISVIEDLARVLGQRPEVVVLYCLKQRYPRLSLAGSEIGTLLDELIDKLGDNRR